MVFIKAPEYGDFGFFTEFRITVLAPILCKFLKYAIKRGSVKQVQRTTFKT